FLCDHLADAVRARGPLASFRVGNQPYGLLPVTSLKRWRPVGETPEDTNLVNCLRALRKIWSLYGGSAPRIEIGTDMPALLRQEANSCSYFMVHLGDSGLPVGDSVPIQRRPASVDDTALHLPPNPNYLSILQQSNADLIR